MPRTRKTREGKGVGGRVLEGEDTSTYRVSTVERRCDNGFETGPLLGVWMTTVPLDPLG